MESVRAESRLPAITPDLVIGRQPGGGWLVRQLSAVLAGQAGLALDDVRGREVSSLFAESTPALCDLADEVAETERKMAAVPVRLVSGGPKLLADVEAGGLGGNYREQLVYFVFKSVRDEFRTEDYLPNPYGLVGNSPGMLEVYRKIEMYARSDAAVLVTGETGTGKELVARALHAQSERRARPFVAVNCSAISAELLESELFGHEKGAFTGALRDHRGRFERAHKGTIFLDEIGDMPLRAQAKLLRVLETGLIERVGAEREVAVDVRVVGATNVPLESAVGGGRFRGDLYHRIAVLRVHLPPLRQRLEDLPLLVGYFLQQFRSRYGREVQRLTPDAMVLLRSYLWPGNVRELRNVLERVYIETQAEVIGARAFAEWVGERQDFSPGEWGVRNDLSSGQRQAVVTPYEPGRIDARVVPAQSVTGIQPGHRPSTRPHNLNAVDIKAACRRTRGNMAAAARLLGVHRATLYRYIQKLGLSRDDLS